MAADPIDAALAATLDGLGGALGGCRDPWWIIGSAAMALHGAPVSVADVDVLLSPDDAAALLAAWGEPLPPASATAKFRSRIFYRSETRFALPVELMAGFEVFGGGVWQPVVPRARVAKDVGSAAVFIASVADLLAMCKLFGRPKDAARAAVLATSI
jgi:hypothetical protein